MWPASPRRGMARQHGRHLRAGWVNCASRPPRSTAFERRRRATPIYQRCLYSAGGACAVRRGEPIVFFCCETGCCTPLCSQCVAGHPRHCFRPVGDVAAPLSRFLVHRAFATSLWGQGGRRGSRALEVELEAARSGGGARPAPPPLPGDAAYGAPTAAGDRLAALSAGHGRRRRVASRLEALRDGAGGAGRAARGGRAGAPRWTGGTGRGVGEG